MVMLGQYRELQLIISLNMNEVARSYLILEISPGASPLVTKQAYRKLAKIWHPDRYLNHPIQKAKAEEKIKQINRAYAIIKAHQLQDGATASNVADNSTSRPSPTKVAKVKRTPEFYFQQGMGYIETEEYNAALNSFALAIKLNPNYLEAYQSRGFILSKLGFNMRADAEFKKAHQIKLKQKITAPYNKQYTTKDYSDRPQSTQTIRSREIIQPWHTIIGFERAIDSLVVGIDRQIASVSDEAQIDLWDLDTGRRTGILKGHSDKVTCLSISLSGRTLISGSKDNTIRFWDLEKKKIIRTFGGYFDGHLGEITALALTPDNQTLISCAADNSLKIWDVNRAREIQNLYFSATITCLAVSPDGRLFCSGDLESELKIRSTKNGQVIRTLNNNSGVLSIAFSPDGNLLAAGGYDGNIQLWDLTTGNQIYTLTGHRNRVSQVIFSWDGKTTISSSWDRTIKVWRLTTGKEIMSQQAHSDQIFTMAMAMDNRALVSGSADNTIKVWHCNL